MLSAGGVIVPPPGYFLRLAELARERGMLLVLDECQTGLGRLGAMYGFERYGIVPDLLVLSKTLGGGVPISALATSAEIEQDCRARLRACDLARLGPDAGRRGVAVIDVVEQEGLAARARSRGDYLLAGLSELQDRHEQIGDVRGLGLLCGLELVEDRDTRKPADALGLRITDECQRCGLSINLVRAQRRGQASCLRMAPPLTVAEDEIDLAVTIIDGPAHVAKRRTDIATSSRPSRRIAR